MLKKLFFLILQVKMVLRAAGVIVQLVTGDSEFPALIVFSAAVVVVLGLALTVWRHAVHEVRAWMLTAFFAADAIVTAFSLTILAVRPLDILFHQYLIVGSIFGALISIAVMILANRKQHFIIRDVLNS